MNEMLTAFIQAPLLSQALTILVLVLLIRYQQKK